MDKRKMLEVLNPIVTADSYGRVYRVKDVLEENGGNWDDVKHEEIDRLLSTLDGPLSSWIV